MIKLIKKIRANTGAGVADIKKALEEAKGDEQTALKILRKKGVEKAVKKSEREANEGVVGSYVHTNERLGAFVKLLCETDFVARNGEFKQLAKDLAMHVSAMNPVCINPEDVDQEIIDEHKEAWLEELVKTDKNDEIKEKIIKGKESKLRSELALYSQSFVKDPERTVEEVIKEKIATLGENIKVSDFIRMEL